MFLKKRAQATLEYIIVFTAIAIVFAYAAVNWFGPGGDDAGLKRIMNLSAQKMKNATADLTTGLLK